PTAPVSITCVMPPTQPINSPSQNSGTMVWMSQVWTLPVSESLLQKISLSLTPGLDSQSFSIMYLIAAPSVPTWMMMPVEVMMASPDALYRVKHNSPSCSTMGDAAIFLAVSRALTTPARSRANSLL